MGHSSSHGSVAAGTVAGNVTIHYNSTPEQGVSLFIEPKPLQADIFDLLRWNSRVTKLVGVGSEFASLQSWLSNEQPGVQIRLLHGEGGYGKTRLAADFGEFAKDQGWHAGFWSKSDLELKLPNGKAVVLIDYPEERPDLVAVLQKLVTHEWQHPLLVLLISRKGTDEWLQKVPSPVQSRWLPKDTISLTGFSANTDAWALYEESLSEFSSYVHNVGHEGMARAAFIDWLSSGAIHQSPLMILALACEHAYSQTAEPILGKDVLAKLAERENSRLIEESKAAGFDQYLFSQLKALSAIYGGLTVQGLYAFLDKAQPYKKQNIDGRQDALINSSLMQNNPIQKAEPDRREAKFIIKIAEPDMLAAMFIHQVLVTRAELERPEWLGDLLVAALMVDVENNVDRLARVVSDLSLLVGDTCLLDPMLNDGLEQGLRERRANDMSRLPQMKLANILAALQVGISFELLKRISDPAEKAMSLNNLSAHLSSLGRQSDALAAVEESVELRRVLASTNPARYNEDLAMSLNNLSNCLSSLGRQSDALAAVEESVELTRVLASTNPARYNEDLASSLNNLSTYLSSLGRQAKAVTAIEECIQIRRVLVKQAPMRYAPDLAGSLAIYSQLVKGQDPELAFSLINEALGLIRPAADQFPDSQYGQWYQLMLGLRDEYQGLVGAKDSI